MGKLLPYTYANAKEKYKVLTRDELLELLGISMNNLINLKNNNYLENRLLKFGWKLIKIEGRGKKSKYTIEKINIKQFTEDELNKLIEEGNYVVRNCANKVSKCGTRILNTILANQGNVETNFAYMTEDLFKILGINDLPALDETKMKYVEKVFIVVRINRLTFRIAGKRTEVYSKVVLPN